jgi:hypothetical protein
VAAFTSALILGTWAWATGQELRIKLTMTIDPSRIVTAWNPTQQTDISRKTG